jgi:hypothetical protein
VPFVDLTEGRKDAGQLMLWEAPSSRGEALATLNRDEN